MTWDHVRWAVRRAGPMDPAAKHVLIVLAVHANPEGRAWPTIETLARETGRHPSTVRYALHRLERGGWVKIAQSKGRRASEVIFIHDPLPPHIARVEPSREARQPSREARQPSRHASQKGLEGDKKGAHADAELSNVGDLVAELRSRLRHPSLGPADDHG